MQDCFRQYPEIYAAELSEDEQEDEGIVPGDEKQQPPPVDGVSEGVARSETKATEAMPADSEKAVSDQTVAKKAQSSSKKAETTESDTAATTSEPAAGSSVSAPMKSFEDDDVQADSSLPNTPPPEAPEAINASHVPKAAFDATMANEK